MTRTISDRCRSCGPIAPTRRMARGLCIECYSWYRYRGRLDEWPRLTRSREWVVARATAYRRRYPSAPLREVAAELGMSPSTLGRALERHRAALRTPGCTD